MLNLRESQGTHKCTSPSLSRGVAPLLSQLVALSSSLPSYLESSFHVVAQGVHIERL